MTLCDFHSPEPAFDGTDEQWSEEARPGSGRGLEGEQLGHGGR